MITNDKEWKLIVNNIANSSNYNKEAIELAAKYLWESDNWERLKETSHGKYLREVDNKVPDLALRSMYREQVLRGNNGST